MNINYWNDCYRERQTSVSKDYDGWLTAHETKLQPGFRVLDLGCGVGTDIEALLKQDARLTALEETIAKRYDKEKKVIEFVAQRN